MMAEQNRHHTRAVGFYWTLPVRWAGFTQLPADIEEAAKASRTIAYQRELIRQYASDNDFELIHEETYLEIEPDRSGHLIRESLRNMEKHCAENDAIFLYVDFSVERNWRSHFAMKDWASRTAIATLPIDTSIYEISINGAPFDPHAHFRVWREKQRAWTAGKKERKAQALARAEALRATGHNATAIAEILERERLRSPNGQEWTRDSVQKLLTEPEA